MDDSPSKGLVEELASFHITSPLRHQGASQLATGRGVNVKKYVPNNDFADSKFFSYLGDSNSKSYVKKLGNWSMSYGTVQQKPKSLTQNNPELLSESNDDQQKFRDFENVEPPQFKQYLENNNVQKQGVAKHHGQAEQNYRGPESELILTASLNDISGIPTNTFKRHNNKKRISPPDHNSGSGHVNNNSDERSQNVDHVESFSDDEDDIDPALEARGVFDNILKKQKSNYEFNRNDPIDMQVGDLQEKYVSDTGSSSYLGETPSSLSPNVDGQQNVKPIFEKNKKVLVEKMGLIKPEDVGLVFNNIDGVWYKPAPRNQDISSSRTTDNTFGNDNSDSKNSITTMPAEIPRATATTRAFPTVIASASDNVSSGRSSTAYTTQSENNATVRELAAEKHKTQRTMAASRASEPSKNSAPNHEVLSDAGEEQEEDDNFDDTPLDVPQINPRFMPFDHQNRLAPRDTDAAPDLVNIPHRHHNMNKKELIKILTDAIPRSQNDWSQVMGLDLSRKGLTQLDCLAEMLPNLTDLKLCANELVDFAGVPPNVMDLDLSNNQITTNYCSKSLPRLLHLQTLNLSHNSLDYNLNFLSPLRHLCEVDLSFNRISSINDNLGLSRIKKLNLSNNEIAGTIDFEKLLQYHTNVYCDKAVCWSTVQELDLSNNQITGLRNLSALVNLKLLILDNNPISTVTDTRSSASLETLSLINTHAKLSRVDISHYTQLKHLRIDLHQRVSHFWDETTLPPDLQALHLQNGQASQLPRLSTLPVTLQNLSLRNVRGLRSLPRELPARLPFLKTLDITGNDFTSWFRIIERIPTFQLRALVLVDNPLVDGLSDQDSKTIDLLVRSVCPKMERLVLHDAAPLLSTFEL
ncbi:hypothetical protein HG535_0E02140 [Zygotorulaspora mrakii]|uniref:Septation initiation network scaffold protein cdc11 n=1 Tax=Zygotorulaspora mrakii TaxID=42260 RepID=A0A7H9B3D5_ZYGMR|nr:uncharacterized protein HG535_0E02140 [Zygotorulaspora mrakii]QLG73130.1 hypothetical protein HG535_0E02140 [Zygotorulaspora mrakii]